MKKRNERREAAKEAFTALLLEAKLDKGTEFKKAELCFSLAAAGCELAP